MSAGEPTVRLVVTDLDNTVYDWVASFVPALYALVDAAVAILGQEREAVLDDLREVHQRHGNSEHPYALLETAAVQRALPGRTQAERFAMLLPAFERFGETRRRTLHLYPGVSDTLAELRRRGVPVVAFTDARVHNALYRIARLGLLEFLHSLYAPEHAVEPVRPLPDPEYLRAIPPDFVRRLTPEDRKPNPKTLLDICAEFGLEPASVVYVGDSLDHDVAMAAAAGVRSAWARYGVCEHGELWAKLVRVSHRGMTDGGDEALGLHGRSVTPPDVSLSTFSELLDAFHFGSRRAR